MIAGLKTNKWLKPIVAELFMIGTKLSFLVIFILQSYFKAPKTIRLKATHYFIMKISNKREL